MEEDKYYAVLNKFVFLKELSVGPAGILSRRGYSGFLHSCVSLYFCIFSFHNALFCFFSPQSGLASQPTKLCPSPPHSKRLDVMRWRIPAREKPTPDQTPFPGPEQGRVRTDASHETRGTKCGMQAAACCLATLPWCHPNHGLSTRDLHRDHLSWQQTKPHVPVSRRLRRHRGQGARLPPDKLRECACSLKQ